MSKLMLAVGAAAIALTAPALAGQDKGHKGGGGGAKAAHGGGGGGGQARGNGGGGGQAKAQRQAVRVERGNGGGRQAERQMGRADRQMVRAERGNGRKAERQAQRVERRKVDRQVARVERRNDRQDERRIERVQANRDDRRDARIVERGDVGRGDFRLSDTSRRLAAYQGFGGLSGLYDNCPPGLARKNNGCLPPGQAKKLIGNAIPASLGLQSLDGPYSQWYRDNDQYYYRDDGDYIYRVNRDGGLIDALFPYQDRDYSYYDVGSLYPADYNYYNVPYQYQSFYPDGNDYSYRYGDGAIYQVNRGDSTINSIVALLAGDLGVGQQLPSDYGVYNVPMAYRDRYYDTPDSLYRYNDGYIYQADAKTQLITAVIDALV